MISRRVTPNNPIQERTIYSLLRGICRALHVMHNYPSGSLAHRDVKPGILYYLILYSVVLFLVYTIPESERVLLWCFYIQISKIHTFALHMQTLITISQKPYSVNVLLRSKTYR